MKADYHFHPNLLAKRPERRLNAIWRSIRKHKLDAVICTEHTYKNASSAYRQLVGAKPNGTTTHVFPGAELITNDGKGIEIIVFAEDDWYDQHPTLLEPFGMAFQEMLRYLSDSDLHYFLPHPYLIGNPIKKLYPTVEAMCEFLSTLPAVEARNGCQLQVEKLCRSFPLRFILTTLGQRLHSSTQPPTQWIVSDSHSFYAIGSDAHHPQDVGFYVDIPCNRPLDRHETFQTLISNRDVSHVHVPRNHLSLRHLAYTGWTVFSESWMKHEWRRYAYQNHAFRFPDGNLSGEIAGATTTHP